MPFNYFLASDVQHPASAFANLRQQGYAGQEVMADKSSIRHRIASRTFVILVMCLAAAPLPAAQRLFYLTFDNLERKPLHCRVIPDEGRDRAPIPLLGSDKLARGVRGFGLLRYTMNESFSFPATGRIDAAEGSISFWLRDLGGAKVTAGKMPMAAAFEHLTFLLLGTSFRVSGNENPPNTIQVKSNAEKLKNQVAPGSWQMMTLTWSAAATNRRVYVNGVLQSQAAYAPGAAGNPVTITLVGCTANRPSTYGNRYVIDEFGIYDAPLPGEAIRDLYEEGKKSLEEAPHDRPAGGAVEISLYPNLLAASQVEFIAGYYRPTPAGYSDGLWETGGSHIAGRMNYDLGAIRKIGSVGLNMGDGIDVAFPESILVSIGNAPDKLREVGRVETAEPFPSPKGRGHGKLAGVDDINQYARYVRIDAAGALRTDEIFVIEAGAKPEFRMFDFSPKANAKTEAATASAPAIAAKAPSRPLGESGSASPWDFHAFQDTDPLTQGPKPFWGCHTKKEPIEIEIRCRGKERPPTNLTAQAELRRFIGKRRQTTGTTAADAEGSAQPESEWSGSIQFSQTLNWEDDPRREGESAKLPAGWKTLVRIPLTNCLYGYHVLDMQVLDGKGPLLAKRHISWRGYHIMPELPKDLGDNILGWQAALRPYMVHRYGLSWGTVLAKWSRFGDEYKPGTAAYTALVESVKGQVQVTKALGGKISMLMLDGIPDHMRKQKGTFEQPFRKWAEYLVSTYGKDVDVWEVWNEPNSKPYAKEENLDLKAIKIVYDLVQKYCPGKPVIMSHHTSGVWYLNRLLDNGMGPYLGGTGLHPYHFLAPEFKEFGGMNLKEIIEECQRLLREHGSKPDIYFTESNYPIWSKSTVDANDQANYVVRMLIMARATGCKSFHIHAFGNGCQQPVAMPNAVLHLMNTTFIRHLDTGNPEVYAVLFRKPDGRFSLPLWVIRSPKLVEIGGLAGRPEVTDLFGNPIAFTYDEKRGVIGSLQLSQAPIYVSAPAGGEPTVVLQAPFKMAGPERAAPGETLRLTMDIGALPAEARTLRFEAPAALGRKVETTNAAPDRRYEFVVAIPKDASAGRYPMVASLLDEHGITLSADDFQLLIATPLPPGVLICETFEDPTLPLWIVQQNVQVEVRTVKREGASQLEIIQKGIDHPATLEYQTAPVQRGELRFGFESSTVEQPFQVSLGAMTFMFDGKGSFGFLDSKGAFQSAGRYEPGKKRTYRIVFDAPKGQCRMWVNEAPMGEHPVPVKTDGYAGLRLVSGTQVTEEPAVFRLEEIELKSLQ